MQALRRPISQLGRQLMMVRAKATLPDLPYDYNALEPVISAEILKVHHDKHHLAYVNNFNMLKEKFEEAVQKGDLTAQFSLAGAYRFNYGGHLNHSIYWQVLCSAKDSGEPSADLLAAINRDFGSLDVMKEKVSAAAIGVQGSGWSWLCYNKATKKLQCVTSANQDPLEATTGLVPIFCIDVWEHAYYLQYKNVRPDYAKAIWQVANWKEISDRFAKAQ